MGLSDILGFSTQAYNLLAEIKELPLSCEAVAIMCSCSNVCIAFCWRAL